MLFEKLRFHARYLQNRRAERFQERIGVVETESRPRPSCYAHDCLVPILPACISQGACRRSIRRRGDEPNLDVTTYRTQSTAHPVQSSETAIE
jgi:hypothetical protein